MTELLDCTLRDGSYEVNFSFSIADTKFICKSLENAGVKLIEIGHGVGLGASKKTNQKALQTDEEYMNAANETLLKSKWGMFCIPGIAEEDDLLKAISNNINFVRIGCNLDNMDLSIKFLRIAKKNDIFTFVNFMKSGNIQPKEFASLVRESENNGADCAYVVDSSGGMFEEEIKALHTEIRDISDINLGFHGHNNLGLANANSLYAAKLGFKYIDSTLQGLGRSSGNAISESLALALIKLNYKIDINYRLLIDAGQNYIRPLIKKNGHRSSDFIAGFVDFHSSYMPLIYKISSKYSVNPLSLIEKVSKVEKNHITEEILTNIAIKMIKTSDYINVFNDLKEYTGGEQNK